METITFFKSFFFNTCYAKGQSNETRPPTLVESPTTYAFYVFRKRGNASPIESTLSNTRYTIGNIYRK